MNSELDKVKTTVTLSMGLKNRLRKLKGAMSYESFIAQLIRDQHRAVHDVGSYIEFQKFERKKAVLSLVDLKVVYSYNKYNESSNFLFDIAISYVRVNGKKRSFAEFLAEKQTDVNSPIHKKGQVFFLVYNLYFQMLDAVIQREIESLFNHRGTFLDRYAWEEEFKRLRLPKSSFEHDVVDKLRNFANGVPLR